MRKLLAETVLKGICYALIAFVYLVFGMIIATPYTFLAGGDVNNFLLTALLAPIVGFLLAHLWIMRCVYREKCRRISSADYVFWGFAMYLSLPIILNGASLFLGQAGYENIAHDVFIVRYGSIVLLPMVLIALAVLVRSVEYFWIKVRGIRGAAPPTPPSDPSQPFDLQPNQPPPTDLEKPNGTGNLLQMGSIT